MLRLVTASLMMGYALGKCTEEDAANGNFCEEEPDEEVAPTMPPTEECDDDEYYDYTKQTATAICERIEDEAQCDSVSCCKSRFKNNGDFKKCKRDPDLYLACGCPEDQDNLEQAVCATTTAETHPDCQCRVNDTCE